MSIERRHHLNHVTKNTVVKLCKQLLFTVGRICQKVTTQISLSPSLLLVCLFPDMSMSPNVHALMSVWAKVAQQREQASPCSVFLFAVLILLVCFVLWFAVVPFLCIMVAMHGLNTPDPVVYADHG